MAELGPSRPLPATATAAAAATTAPSTTTSTVASTSTVPQKKRIRAVVACSYCRSKRSKCDGVPGRQACTECQQRGIDCEMTDGKRNRWAKSKPPPRNPTELLLTSPQGPLQTAGRGPRQASAPPRGGTGTVARLKPRAPGRAAADKEPNTPSRKP